ncbi:MAG: hypothetical protein K2P95_08910, partial [Hyphomonadaceae bacterium]|nr:hypothetical protein [Hyphomonadaceae bacterium]
MRRGERAPRAQAVNGEGERAALLPAIARLVALLGRLDAPGLRLRLGLALALTVAAKVITVFAPLTLAEGVNQLSAGDAQAALPAFL